MVVSVRLAAVAVGLGSDQVRDLCACDLKPANHILQQPIGVGDPFVLAQVLEPALHEKRLDHASWFGSIFERRPPACAVAPTLMAELFKGGQEWLAVVSIDAVFDRDQDRAAVLLDVMRQNRRRPSRR